MKTHSLLLFLLLAGGVGKVVHAQEVRLSLECVGASVQLTHDTAQGKVYAVQSSSNLVTWADTGLSKAGDGLVARQNVGLVGSGPMFFRLVVSDSPVDLAPTPARMAELLVGKKQFSYSFTSATRFAWNTETGNWTYTKTGAVTGLLVLTYDGDGNNASLYREEIALTFTSALGGSYQYAEFTHDIKTGNSSGFFTLN